MTYYDGPSYPQPTFSSADQAMTLHSRENQKYIDHLERSHAAQVTIIGLITSTESMDMRWEQLKSHLAEPIPSTPYEIPPGLAGEKAVFSTIPENKEERKEFFQDMMDDEDEESKAKFAVFQQQKKDFEEWQQKVYHVEKERNEVIEDRLHSVRLERRKIARACQQRLKDADIVGPIKGQISRVMTRILSSRIAAPEYLYVVTEEEFPHCDIPPMPPAPTSLAAANLSVEEQQSLNLEMFNRPTSLAAEIEIIDDRINRKRDRAMLSAKAAGFSNVIDYFIHYHSTTITAEEKDRMNKATQLELDWLKQHPAKQLDARGASTLTKEEQVKLESELDTRLYDLLPPAPDQDDFLQILPEEDDDRDATMI